MEQTLYDKKWKKFLRRAWPFQCIPFIDFVLGAGSMVMGNATPESDFDVIVGARSGRIFTVRFLCYLVFGSLGLWANHRTNKVADRFCFNHFVTPRTYKLSPPHNAYWRALYQKLVPIFGSREKIQLFEEANSDWAGNEINYDKTKLRQRSDLIKKIGEWVLGGDIGNKLEKLLKFFQVKKIEKSLGKNPSGYQPRIKYSDEELEFHPGTQRKLRFK